LRTPIAGSGREIAPKLRRIGRGWWPFLPLRSSTRIGVVFGQRSQLWREDLPLAESFDLHAAIHRVPGARYRERLAECVEMLDMAPFPAMRVRQLSLGQRMRGEVTAALLHAPSCSCSTSRRSGSTSRAGRLLAVRHGHLAAVAGLVLVGVGRRRSCLGGGGGCRSAVRHRRG
jgi:hypothetical protein